MEEKRGAKNSKRKLSRRKWEKIGRKMQNGRKGRLLRGREKMKNKKIRKRNRKLFYIIRSESQQYSKSGIK